ncbi:unnamed protein product, partial [Ectocarpus sp. 13 AM-2016]
SRSPIIQLSQQTSPPCTRETTRTCIDYVLYYPDQRLPNGAYRGFFAYDGSILSYSELAEDSDFHRTFGIVDTRTSIANGEEGDESSSSSCATLPVFGLFAVFMTAALVLEAVIV